MNNILRNPINFRKTKYRSLSDIATAFMPVGVDRLKYQELLAERFSRTTPKTENDFLRNIKPIGAHWFFFNGQFYKDKATLLTQYGIPQRMERYVSELISDDLIETENSLTMLVQEFKRGVVEAKINKQKPSQGVSILGRRFADLKMLSKEVPFLDIQNVIHSDTPSTAFMDELNSYVRGADFKIGVCHISDFDNLSEYTNIREWDLISKLKMESRGKPLEQAIWPHISKGDSPVVINGELFKHIDDGLRCYAISWCKAMASLMSSEKIVSNDIKMLFENEELIGSDEKNLVKFEGLTMPLSELMRLIGGKSSIFIYRMKELEDEFNLEPLQEIIEKHLLKKSDSALHTS